MVEISEDLFSDPQIKHRGHFVFLDHPEIGHHAIDGNPFTLSESPAKYHRPAPLLGQHTAYVLRELLGISDAEIKALEAEGVLE